MDTSIRLPLRVRIESEAVVVRDTIGTGLSYIYFEDEPIRRQSAKRVTKAQAREIARAIARTLTDRFSGPETDKPGAP